jgi:serine-type D-Ala-D-Ala carboxypeptidase (penicillin-binding protein 5/6)
MRRLLPLIATALALVLAAASPARAAAPDCPAAELAPAAIAIEVDTGTVACERNADERRSIASTTKLMTALLTLERAKLSDVFTAARYSPSAAESLVGLEPGERMSVRDLMRGLLAQSGNDAAVTLAEGVSGSRAAFVRAMNRRAQQLGLKNTHYDNPIGLDGAGNYSSARDLVRLATLLMTKKFFRTTVDRAAVRLVTGDHERTFRNRNDLVGRFPWIDGVKTGHTRSAGYVMVGAGRDGRGVQLISAVLGTSGTGARDDATLAVLRGSFRRFQRITAVKRDDEYARVPIRYRRGAELPLVAGHSLMRVVPRGHRGDVSTKLEDVPDDVTGPVVRGQSFGTIVVYQKGKRVGRVPLVAGGSVPAAGLAAKAQSWFTGPIALLLAAAALAGTVLLVRQLRHGLRGRHAREEARPA